MTNHGIYLDYNEIADRIYFAYCPICKQWMIGDEPYHYIIVDKERVRHYQEQRSLLDLIKLLLPEGPPK